MRLQVALALCLFTLNARADSRATAFVAAYSDDDMAQAHNATRAFRRGLMVDPSNATLRAYLGTALKDLGDLDGALFELRRALELDPQNAYAKFNLAWVTRLQQADSLKSTAEAALAAR